MNEGYAMSITQQYALDLYRAGRQGVPAPPAPGLHDWRTVRELRDHVRVEKAGHSRPARRPWRHALAVLLWPPARRRDRGGGTLWAPPRPAAATPDLDPAAVPPPRPVRAHAR